MFTKLQDVTFCIFDDDDQDDEVDQEILCKARNVIPKIVIEDYNDWNQL